MTKPGSATAIGRQYAHLYSKLTAHTLRTCLNCLMGKLDYPQIKKLAFPN